MCARRSTIIDLNNLDFTQLSALHALFQENKNEKYDKKGFCLAVKQTIGPNLTDQEIEKFFVMVNTRFSKSIYWSDFIRSIKGVQERIYLKDTLVKSIFFDPKVSFTQTKHRKSIVSIRFMPILTLQSEAIDYSRGRYVMLDRDGLLSLWSISVRPIRYYWIGHDRFLTSMHYTDMVVLYPTLLIAVASTSRCITIWEVIDEILDRKYDIVEMNAIPTCLDFWAKLPSGDHSVLIWGDSAGDVYCLSLNVISKINMFVKEETREKPTRVSIDDFMNDRIKKMKLYKTSIARKAWVTKVQYLPNSESFLASCDSVTNPVCVSDWHGGKQRRSFTCHTGVQCIAYSKHLNIIAMGCMDMSVRVFNFFMTKTPIMELRGYGRSVVAIAIREVDEHIISVEKSHAVSVHSLKSQVCVQRFAGGDLLKLGKNPISSSFYNPVSSRFLMATTVLVKLGPDQTVNVPQVGSSSKAAVGVVYSPMYERVICVCREGIISMWDVHDGLLIMQLRHVSSRALEETDYEPNYNKMEVTAFIMENTGQRLVTGASDGTINLWNISTGVLINAYCLPDPVIVSAFAIDKLTVYAAGGDRMVYFFNMDEKNNESLRHLWPVHKEDITCMTILNSGLVTTASTDGDIVIVDREIMQIVCKLNPCQSRFPFLITSARPVKRPSLEQLSAIEGQQPADQTSLALPDTYFDVLKGEYVSRSESDRLFWSYDNSVDVLLYLELRQLHDKNTAVLVTAGSEGWIRAWSLHKLGGLQGQFCATSDLGESVLAMTTDPQNEFLISADTRGYVKVWDLLLYCNGSVESVFSDESRNKRNEMLLKKFIFLKHSFFRDEAAEGKYDPHKRPPPLASEPESTLKIPRLLNVFRAHSCPITCITYVADRELIITGDLEKMVCLWLLSGVYIGTCGEAWSGLISPQRTMYRQRKLPLSLRRCASSRTFRVVHGGHMAELWQRAMSVLQSYIRRGCKALITSEQSLVIEEKEEPSDNNDVDVMSVAPIDQSDPKRSHILGSTFKPNLHYKKRPFIDLPQGQFLGFRHLTIHDLDENIPSTKPQTKTRKIKTQRITSRPRADILQTPNTASSNNSASKAQVLQVGFLPGVRSSSGLNDYNSGTEGYRTPPTALDNLSNSSNRSGGHAAGLFRRDNPAGRSIMTAPYPSRLPPLTTAFNSMLSTKETP